MTYAAYLGGRNRTLTDPRMIRAVAASAISKAAGGTGAFVVGGTASKPVVKAIVPGGLADVTKENLAKIEVAHAQALAAKPAIAPRIAVDTTPITRETLPSIAPKQEVTVTMGPESKQATVSTGDGKTVETPVASVTAPAPSLSVSGPEPAATGPAPAAAAPATPTKGGEGGTPTLIWIAGGVAAVALVLFIIALRKRG